MIRKCQQSDLQTVIEIINDAAQAYKGVIPEDRWQEPYMPMDELTQEIADGVEFWCYEENSEVAGVMGIQELDDVTLIRHAYVRSDLRRRGIGSKLLEDLRKRARNRILMGTWKDAGWAVAFYEKHGFRQLPSEESARLLRKYWNIPERQIETSVVLAEDKTD